jgi:hypothetical protein
MGKKKRKKKKKDSSRPQGKLQVPPCIAILCGRGFGAQGSQGW